MSSNSVLNAVEHYQRSIEKNPEDVARLLHCVGKLYKIPITVEHLHKTGVGRTVNALRKYEGELAIAAEAVINKWKQLVAIENDTLADNQNSANEQDSDEDEENDSSPEKNDNNQTPTKQYTNSAAKEIEKSESSRKHSKSHSKNHETPSSSSSLSHKNHERSTHKSDRTDKSKEHRMKKDSHKREDEREHKSHHKSHRNDKIENAKEKKHHGEHKRKPDVETSNDETNKKERISKEIIEQHRSSSNGSSKKHKHHDKHRNSSDREKSNSEHKTPNSNSSNAVKSVSANIDGPSTSSAVLAAESSNAKIKRRHENADSEIDNLAKKPKNNNQEKDKKHIQKGDKNEGDIDDGIDSSMGANFADVLGMLNMPKKKAKKSLSALKNTSPKSTPKTSESDTPKISFSSKTNDNNNRKKEMPTSSTSQSKLEKKPELLTSKAKLPPLDPSIVLDLPVISNNYKPLPLNPMVMDCVFNSTTSSSSRAPPPRLLSDADALSHGISSKTMRTKVYSGVKTGQLHQVPSLFDLCIRILQKNIDALEYTGGVPFDVLRAVLERATPQQLFNFEEYNPYLMEDSDVLWKMHVERNYRGHKREEMESWREMFIRCQENQERRLNMLAENIKQSQKAIALPVRKTQLAFVDSMVKPPRNVIRKQEQYGTKSKVVATPAARVAALSNVTPNAAKQGDARLRVAAAFSQDPVKLSSSFARPKKAPLMAKTLQFMRGRLKR